MDKPDEKYKIIRLYSETPKAEDFIRSLKLWCKLREIDMFDLPMFLICVVKIPTLDFDYDEAYRALVERGYLTLKEHKVPTNRKEVIHS